MNDIKPTIEQTKIINSLKGIEKSALRQAISIFDDESRSIGYLKAVDIPTCESEYVINKMVQWRKSFSDAFFTRFDVTFERTRNWLKNIVIPDCSRILFLVYDFNDTLYGHFGITGISKDGAELDNTIHGEPGGPRFYHVERSIIHFCFKELNMQYITARVFSNNTRALILHSRVGLRIKEIRALKIIQHNGDIRYEQVEDDSESNTDLKVCHLYINRNEFYKKHSLLECQQAIHYMNL